MLRELFVSIGVQWKCAPCCSNGRDKSLGDSSAASREPAAKSGSEDAVAAKVLTSIREDTTDHEDFGALVLESYNDRVPSKQVGMLIDSEDEGTQQDAAGNGKVILDLSRSLKKSLEKAEKLIEIEEEEEAERQEEAKDSEEEEEKPSPWQRPAKDVELLGRMRKSVHGCAGMIHDPVVVKSVSTMAENNSYLHEDIEPAGLIEWRASSQSVIPTAKTKDVTHAKSKGQLASEVGDDSGDEGVNARYEKHNIAQRAQDLRNKMREEGEGQPFSSPKREGHAKMDAQNERQRMRSAYLAEVKSYQDDMRWKFEAIGIERSQSQDFVSTASPSAAVRDAVAKYHGHCQEIGRFYAMPGETSTSHHGLEDDQKAKLLHYQRDLMADTLNPRAAAESD